MAISIVDNANGTGVTIASSGSAESVLQVARFEGGVTQAAFATIATIAGDGSTVILLDEGAYFAIWRLDGVYQAPVGFRVTDGRVGIHERCLQEIRTLLLGLSLPAYPSDATRHKTHKRPIRTMKEFGENPFGVHYWKLPESFNPVDNWRNSVTFPIQVALVASSGGNNISSGDWTLSRQMIIQAFARCPLMALPEIHSVNVDPGEIYAVADSSLNVDLQSMIFRCVTELPAVL